MIKRSNNEKAILVGIDKDGKRTCVEMPPLSKEAQEELDAIKLKVNKMLQPMHDAMGVDTDIESLYWTNGEVFVVNNETGKRREIHGKTQTELNRILVKDAVRISADMKND